MYFNLKELAEIRSAEEKSKKIKKQLKSGKPEEIKVYLKLNEVNDYQELWKVVGEERYFSRYTCGVPVWYTVCDPLGYAELNNVMPVNKIFVICDKEGNELFATSNLDGADFPTLEEMCRNEWLKIKASYPHCKDNADNDFVSQFMGLGTTIGADKWLLTFKDPEIYGAAARDYDENWVFHKEKTKEELLSEFSYLGTDYGIWKVTYRHRDCGKEMYEYWVALFEDGSKDRIAEYGLIQFLDSYYEGAPGTMYLKRDAIDKVKDALEKIYQGKAISEINKAYDRAFERFIGYDKAAEKLLNGNWNRKFVDELIISESENHTFYITRDPEIEEKFPGYIRDHSYNYDFLGRRI